METAPRPRADSQNAVPPVIPPQLRPPAVGLSRPPPLPSLIRPGVILFYRWWCVLFFLLYSGMATYQFLVAAGRAAPNMGLIEEFVSKHSPQAHQEIVAEKRADAPFLGTFVAAIGILYLAAIGLPRKPSGWTIGLVVICTTIFPFIITAAGTVPLIIQWAKPETKRYFNRTS